MVMLHEHVKDSGHISQENVVHVHKNPCLTYLSANSSTSCLDRALVALGTHKHQEKPFSFEVYVPGLGSGVSATVKACAAWAVLLASHGRTAELSMFAPGPVGFIGPLSISIHWGSCVRDLICQIQAELGFSSQCVGEAAFPDNPRLSGKEGGYLQTFLIGIPQDEPDSGEMLLECQIIDERIHARPVGYNRPSSKASSKHFVRQYEYIVREICSRGSAEKPLINLKAISIQDLKQIWSWNVRVPQSVNHVCIHEAFMERARRHPDKMAVSAHDGELTYGELDDLSTRLANFLIQEGVQHSSTIIIFLEKSMWVPVAQLAVMKCGCASTVLDASLPLQRQQSIAELVQASAALTSPACEKKTIGLGLGCAHFVLDNCSSQSWPSPQPDSLPTVCPSSWLYIVFTSGSTGTPKGAIISHANYASAIATQQKALDFREFDRVFDFASYAFDASWCNLIHALVIGGCLCIPSDEERKGDLAGALRKYQVNYAILTPSVAWFPACELPSSLRTIHFGGEPLTSALVKELSVVAKVINAYGPAECSTVSTAIATDPNDDNDPTIGTGLGACTWIVKPDGTDLVPVGEIGELWLEGPIVGQGYLRDPEKTAASFVDNPSWLLHGCPSFSGMKGHTGRRGRVYRTGDLVRYRADGKLEFVGRKDSQVKIRGQRVELGEIEHNLQRALAEGARAENVQTVADVIKPDGSDVPTLVCFLFLPTSSGVSAVDAKPILHRALAGLEDRLAEFVPPYMIPSAFLPVEDVPMTPTGKLDRRCLRENGKKLYWQQLNGHSTPDQVEVGSGLEEVLRQVWAEVLNLPLEKIRLDSPFTRLGGDSITAMQVVSRCRSQKIFVKVADILKLQTVRLVAGSSKPAREKVNWIGSQANEGEAWPLTPIQQILFENNPQGINHYTLSYIVKLVRPTTHEEFMSGLLAVTTRHSMLRARFRKRKDGSTWEQYLAPPGISSFLLKQHHFVDRSTMQQVVDERQASMDLINGPTFAVDVFNNDNEAQTVLMSAHHAMMDLVSWRIIWHDLSQYLSGITHLSPVEISFQAWCHLQREEAERLDPATVLPFKVTPANFQYWGVTPGEVFFRDSTLNLSIVDAEATALLLGASNDGFRTEILDILIGTLIFCFCQVFPDRKPPPVFLEGHGRELMAGMHDLDLSEVVGWFTSIHPIELGGGPGDSILDMIKFAKDTRRRVPNKGRPYFASRFYSETGRKAFEGHNHVELIFNYRGSFQQLEDANSVFRLEDRKERDLLIPGEAPEYQRPSLIDLNLVVLEGKLQVWSRSHRHMQNHEAVIRWINLYAKSLSTVAHELVSLPPRYTLSDFPLLDISSAGLEMLMAKLASEGIEETKVQDIYPCTSMQEGILISSHIGAASYHSVSIWQAVLTGSAVSVSRLKAAWETVSHMHPVFSTVFFTNPDNGHFIQVVLNDPNEALVCQATDSTTAVEHLEQMQGFKASPSQPQCFFTICTDQEGQVACRLDMTHALMDALSLPIIVRDFEKAYSGQDLSLCVPFRNYVEHIQRTPASDRLLYWRTYLAGATACNMPGDIAASPQESHCNNTYGWINLPESVTAPISKICREKELTRSAFLHLAWSLTLASFTGMRRVCFGYISSGRDTPIDGIEDIVGPLINMLIASVDLDKPLADITATIRRYHINHLENQHASLAEIQHDISVKRLFNTNITVREARGGPGAVDGSMELVEVLEEDPHEYDLVLAATLNKAETSVGIQYRADFVTSSNAQAIKTVLTTAIEFLGSVMQQNTPAAKQYTEHCESLYDAYFLYTAGIEEMAALERWKVQFNGIDADCHFPLVPYAHRIPNINASTACTIENLQWRRDYDETTQLFASWALLQASYGGSSDVMIGARSFGTEYRATNYAMPMPLRITANLDQSVSSYLDTVQSTVETWSNLPKLPIHRLRSISEESALACGYQTVLNVERAADQGEGQGSHENPHGSWVLSVHLKLGPSRAHLAARFDENVISAEQVGRFFSQLETVLRQLCSPINSSSPLIGIDTISSQDLQDISSWNGEPYEEVQDLVHNLISRTVRRMPDSLAVSSWDGELTYRQLDEMSTRLSYRLLELGVRPEHIVPLYFEKSIWVPVSIVAIMKAGGAGVMIDCAQPVERACSIVSQVNAKLVLTSKTNVERATQFKDLQLLIIDEASVNALPEPVEGLTLPQHIQPSNLLYVSFTSGSTGKPKGAMITHSCFASSIKHQQGALGFRAGQRVYDFASYAFDASWSNVLHSLTSGSCLCIPSEDQRSNALSDSIRDTKATLLNATPSVLRHIDPKELPNLEQVLMGGEAWAEADFVDWIDNTKLINSYGPGECTIKSCLIRAFRGMIPNTVGVGIGLNTWIVRTDGSDRLAPLGAVGELWLEGPQVGRGYIADESRTAASFLTRRKWTEGLGKACRFYRTGDLVRYGPDGTIVFVSRIDSQVKIRGQRTELGEIESSIQKALSAGDVKAQVIADVFKPYTSENPILVAFLKPEEANAGYKLAGLDERLAKMVPEYMVPTAYITLQKFPMTATGKIHRRSIRETYTKKTLEQIVALDAFRASSRRAPSTTSEKILRDLWAQILHIDPLTISADDSFLRIGGDSLGAMRLVGAARKLGFTISVADVFKQPKLSALAKIIKFQKSIMQPEGYGVEAFSLLERVTSQEAKIRASSLCGLETSDIEDVFPCTPLQAGLLAETVRRPGDNVLTETWVFRKNVDVDRFRTAWQKVIRANPILRTRIVDLEEEGLVQVIARYERCDIENGALARDFGLSTPLVCYEISESGFSWSIHHALYDGWSMPLILDLLAQSYQSRNVPKAPPFQAFIKHLRNCNQIQAEDFWTNQFCDFDAQIFPSLPNKTYKPSCDRRLKVDIEGVALDGDFTVATRIRLAWAVLLSTLTNRTDASFGATVSGRHANVPGIEGITGPTFATVPLRIVVDRSKTVKQLLQQVQLQTVDMMPFEHTGMQYIRRLSENCNLGCQFQSHMVIQPGGKNDVEDSLFESSFVHSETEDVDPFKAYAICLEFVLTPNKICLHASYDSTVVPPTQFRRLADRFENILKQISSPQAQGKTPALLDLSSLRDLKQIWGWNGTSLERSYKTVHEIFRQVAMKQPEAPAVCSWDGDVTYAQVDEISTRIAYELVRSGLPQRGQRIVPLLFEKSKWTSVCQIAVMKANGTSVVLDATLPGGRLHTIIDLVRPQIILTSAKQESRARELVPSTTRVIVVSDVHLPSFRLPDDAGLPVVDSDTWLYVVFTSGSTGIPKGAIISHSNFTSALKFGQAKLKFGPHTRAYDFVSYAFDVSWLNALYTLCAGGCLCVPSQHEIQNEPKEAIDRRRANTAFITPTVGKLLHGAELKVINYGGENLGRDEIKYWKDRAQIIHSYGPSECTPISISHVLDPTRSRVIIGKGLGARTWIVEPERGNSLAAIGDIGELWLEGPLVGQGYLDDPERTDGSFVNDPEWLIRGGPGFPGCHGRLYRTGDLVRYEEDGNLEFIGRKDAQRKIRGQRVELEEIEHHILDAIGEAVASQVVVDIVKPADSTEPVLVAFIKLTDERIAAGTPEPQAYTQELSASIRDRLSATVPSYMIPNGYLIVHSIPNTTSGKVDRGKLAKSVSQIRKEDLLQVDCIERRAPETPQEIQLHAIVAEVLFLDGESFGMDNNFIQLGGDSISAMRLASIARDNAISLGVADILTKERISDLLVSHQEGDLGNGIQKAQFDMRDAANLSSLVEEEVMQQVQSGHGKLIDILPATDMQSTYLRDNLYSPRRSWFYSYINFGQALDERRLIQSCLKLVEHCDIYRTAFVRSGDSFFQTVFDSWEPTIDIVEDIDCVDAAFDKLIGQEMKLPASLGSPLAHFKLLRGRDAKAKLVFSMSHAVYDAISFGQTLQILTTIYNGLIPKTEDFRFYARHVQSHKAKSYSYWRKTLENSLMTTIPSISAVPLQDKAPTVLVHSVPMPTLPSGITQASFFTLACASALSRLTGSSDIVFGRVVSGRATVPASLQHVVGPCLNRVPVRVQFTPGQTKVERLVALQKQYAESLRYETTGLSDIVKNCTDWPQNTKEFGCWTQYQNVDEKPILGIPGAIGGLGSKNMWHIPVEATFLEVFAMPSGEGTLVVRLIAGSAYSANVQAEMLEGVCSELLHAF